MNAAAPGRLSHLFRWLGITLVALLGLQLLSVLAVNGWGEESFVQLLSGTLVTQSPMAFVGLTLMLIAARLDDPRASGTPLQRVVALISGILALALLITIPVSINGDHVLSEQADQALLAQKGQLEMARAQLKNPQLIDQVIAQGQQAGQIPATATEAQKREAAESFMSRQLKQADDQLKQAERRRDLAANQRRIGGLGTAVVLLVAFSVLAMVAVL